MYFILKKMFDFKIETPCRVFLAGASESGKTYRVFRIIEYSDILFKRPEEVEHVIYFYNVWTKEYEKNKHMVHEWVNEKPTSDLVLKKTAPFKKTGCLVVIDDFGCNIGQDLIQCFTVLSHHNHISLFLLSQNLFPKQGLSREFRLNLTHTLIFKQNVDRTQFSNLAKQFKPEHFQAVKKAYRRATRRKYGYLCVLHQDSLPETLRLYSRICPDQWPPEVYITLDEKPVSSDEDESDVEDYIVKK